MITEELLAVLCCPESHQALRFAPAPLIESINQQIARGEVRNRAGTPVQEKIESGLIRADGQWLYPIRNGIPILLVDEALVVGGR
jgi:uncharacterized protein YbaR (Trm112 family)